MGECAWIVAWIAAGIIALAIIVIAASAIAQARDDRLLIESLTSTSSNLTQRAPPAK